VSKFRVIGSQIVFADCIEENPAGREFSGRIKHYTDEILRGLLEYKDRKGKHGGVRNCSNFLYFSNILMQLLIFLNVPFRRRT
jgi:hypothetical protein